MRLKTTAEQAFSLIEVVLAIGILSFMLVALLGLFSVGLGASQRGTNDTTIASIWARIYGELQATNSLKAGTFTVYYDRQGLPGNSATAHFACRVTSTAVSATQLTDVTNNILSTSIEITWPAAVPAPKRPNTNIINAMLLPR
ncbi:MAG: hypothetical protein ACAI35_18915 [Candidatus Methylacidiphilales bacterium]